MRCVGHSLRWTPPTLSSFMSLLFFCLSCRHQAWPEIKNHSVFVCFLSTPWFSHRFSGRCRSKTDLLVTWTASKGLEAQKKVQIVANITNKGVKTFYCTLLYRVGGHVFVSLLTKYLKWVCFTKLKSTLFSLGL